MDWEKFMATMKTLLVLLCVVAASSVRGDAQDSPAATNATVINESLPVYSQMSRSSKVVTSLKKGDKVTVDFEATGAGEAWCSLRGLGGSGGTGYVQCKGLERAPRAPEPAPPPTDRSFLPLRLEWPAWLEVPGGRLISKRTNPPGRIGKWLVETCPGDVLGKPSQGCLARVYQSSRRLRELYEYFDGLLGQYGYTTQSASTKPYANLELGKFIAEPFAQLKMREYPGQGDETYYQQIVIFIRQPQSPTTKVEITFMVKNGSSATPAAMKVASTPSQQASSGSAPLAWYEVTPRSKDEWKWAIQSVATRSGAGVKYTNYYYEQATNRIVDERLPLPNGGVIVHAFPVDCAFYIEDDRGNRTKFASAQEARGKAVGPGNWTVYPIKVSGVVVYFK